MFKIFSEVFLKWLIQLVMLASLAELAKANVLQMQSAKVTESMSLMPKNVFLAVHARKFAL
jgi:hypothetical protein